MWRPAIERSQMKFKYNYQVNIRLPMACSPSDTEQKNLQHWPSFIQSILLRAVAVNSILVFMGQKSHSSQSIVRFLFSPRTLSLSLSLRPSVLRCSEGKCYFLYDIFVDVLQQFSIDVEHKTQYNNIMVANLCIEIWNGLADAAAAIVAITAAVCLDVNVHVRFLRAPHERRAHTHTHSTDTLKHFY